MPNTSELADMGATLDTLLHRLHDGFASHGIHLGLSVAQTDMDGGVWQRRVWKAADELDSASAHVKGHFRGALLVEAARAWVRAVEAFAGYRRDGMPWCANMFAHQVGSAGAYLGRWEASRSVRV